MRATKTLVCCHLVYVDRNWLKTILYHEKVQCLRDPYEKPCEFNTHMLATEEGICLNVHI